MNRTVLRDLGRALRVLGTHGDQLEPATATTEQLDEIAADMQRARRILGDAERPPPTTDCAEHPYGPVEPPADPADPPTRTCLFCTLRRHRARPAGRPEGRPT